MDAVHGPDQLHSLKVIAVQLGQHGLKLGTVKHPHHRRLDHIVEMMSQGDLIAAQLLRLAVKGSPAHSGTEIAGRFFGAVGHLENIRFKDRDGNVKQSGVVFNFLSVDGVIARVHYQKHQVKGDVTVAVKLLHQLGHQHGILAAGDTHSNFVSGLDQPVLFNGMSKRIPKLLQEFFDDASFNQLIRLQYSRHPVFPLIRYILRSCPPLYSVIRQRSECFRSPAPHSSCQKSGGIPEAPPRWSGG